VHDMRQLTSKHASRPQATVIAVNMMLHIAGRALPPAAAWFPAHAGRSGGRAGNAVNKDGKRYRATKRRRRRRRSGKFRPRRSHPADLLWRRVARQEIKLLDDGASEVHAWRRRPVERMMRHTSRRAGVSGWSMHRAGSLRKATIRQRHCLRSQRPDPQPSR